MTIIEYLSQYEKAEQEIRDVAKKRDHWIEMATSVGCSTEIQQPLMSRALNWQTN